MGFAAAVQPGPTQLYLVSQSLINGWKRSLPLAAVYLVSDIPIIALVLFVLNVLPDWFNTVLRLGGGLFLLYLAWKAAQTFKKFDEVKQVSPSPAKTFMKAVTINLLNPNPYIEWSLVMGPLVLNAWRESPVTGILVLAGFYGSIVLVSAAYIVLFGVIRNTGSRISRILVGVSAVALAGFGIYQIILGISVVIS